MPVLAPTLAFRYRTLNLNEPTRGPLRDCGTSLCLVFSVYVLFMFSLSFSNNNIKLKFGATLYECCTHLRFREIINLGLLCTNAVLISDFGRSQRRQITRRRLHRIPTDWSDTWDSCHELSSIAGYISDDKRDRNHHSWPN